MKHISSKSGIQVAKGAVSIFLAQALLLPTGFITAIFLAHKLGPADYGVFALVSSLVLMIEWLAFSGLTDTSVKFVAETPDWEAVGITVIRLHIFMGVCAASFLWLFAESLAELFRDPVLADYFRLFAIDIPLFGLACAQRNILVGIRHFHERAKVTATRYIARLIFIVLFVACGFSIKGAILGSIGASVLECAYSFYFVQLPLLSRITFPVRKLFAFAGPLFLSVMCLHVAKLDLLMLKIFGGSAVELGFYGAALNISIVPVLFFVSLAQPILTLISGVLLKENYEDARKYTLMCFRSIFWLIPFAALISGSSSEIVMLIYGYDFYPAGKMLEILIFAGLAVGVITFENAVFTAFNEPKMTLWFSVPMIPFILVGNYYLIPIMGGVGTAMVKTVVVCVAALMAGIVTCWKWKIKLPVSTIVSSIICSGMAYTLATYWSTAGSLLILKLFLVTCIIFLVFALFKEIGSAELVLAKKVLRFREKTGVEKVSE